MKSTGFSTSLKGKNHQVNQDSLLLMQDLGVFAVFDGMGGHAAGDVASKIAAETLRTHFLMNKDTLLAGSVSDKDLLDIVEEGIQSVCNEIFQYATSHPDCGGMGTTAALLLVNGNRGVVANVGDSRVYLSRRDGLEQLTRDHTIVQELIDQGIMRPEARDKSPINHILSRALGLQPSVLVDSKCIDIIPGDKFLVTSDGVNEATEDYGAVLRLLAHEPSKAVQEIAEQSVTLGSLDDTTAIVVSMEATGALSPAQLRHVEQVTLTTEVLKQTKFFADLDPDERLKVIECCSIVTCEANDSLMQEGAEGDCMFVILKGELGVFKGTKKIATLSKGNHVGEMALIGGKKRSADVTAISSSDLLCLRANDFNDLLCLEPRIGVKLLLTISKELCSRLEVMNVKASHA